MRVLLLSVFLIACAHRPVGPETRIHPAPCPTGQHWSADTCVTSGPAAPVALTIPLHWVGEWTSGADGVKFSFDIRLTPKGNGLEGRILWTLISVPPGHFLASRINDYGQETVQGAYDSSTRTLHLKGTAVDDDTLLLTDEYKLFISADNQTFSGRTRGHKGDWMNEIQGRRADD